MSNDFRSPDGYVNPVPEPGERRPHSGPNVSLPSLSTPITARTAMRLVFGVIAVGLVFAGPIRGALDSLVNQGRNDGSVQLDGSMSINNGAVTAAYTPTGGEAAHVVDHSGSNFKGTEWNLTDGSESVYVRDYRFDSSPVESRAETKLYFAATGREFNMTSGHDVKPTAITVDGRHGQVWETRADAGGWILAAEFPGDPSTVRMRCSAASVESEIAVQCKEILKSLKFKG